MILCEVHEREERAHFTKAPLNALAHSGHPKVIECVLRRSMKAHEGDVKPRVVPRVAAVAEQAVADSSIYAAPH